MNCSIIEHIIIHLQRQAYKRRFVLFHSNLIQNGPAVNREST